MEPERRPVFPVVLAGIAAFLSLYATQPLLPMLAQAFHASNFAVSLTITAPTIAVALASPFAGSVADAMGRKRVIVWAAVALAVTTALAATADSLKALIVWRFVQGLFTPGIVAVTIAYIHEEYPKASAGSATAAYISGTVIGGFSGRALTGVVAGFAGWHAAFLAVALLNAAFAAGLWTWLPREQLRARAAAQVSRAASMLGHLRNRQLLASYAIGYCVLFVQVALFTYVTFVLAAPPYHLSSAALGWLFVTYLVGAAVTPIAGRSIDRRGHRFALAVAIAIGVTGSLLTLLKPLALIVTGLSLAATGVFIAQATTSSHVASTAARDRGLAVGLYGTFYYGGGASGGALPAAFWNLGGWTACVSFVIAVQVSTAVLAFAFWNEPRAMQPR